MKMSLQSQMPDSKRMEQEIAVKIIDAFKHSILPTKDGEEQPESRKAARFFKHWFVSDHNRCLFFLFKKNLSVTDIQFAELLSLLKTHSQSVIFSPVDELQFLSVDEFYDTVDKMIEAFLTKSPELSTYELMAKLYQPIFARTVAIQSRFGSCEVYIPPHLEVQLAPLCAAAGYIHSCGYSVYVRAAYKAIKKDFLRDLQRYVNREGDHPEKRLYFAAYAHEDFDKYDQEEGRDFRHGLDDVKIHLNKFYLGTHRLVEIVNDVHAELHRFLEVAQPGASGRDRKIQADQNRDANISPDRTIWLLVDRATTNLSRDREAARKMGQASRQPGETTYFICFDQHFVNENPYHLFDENKPAWEDHTTIPHTLMGAMINITRPWWPIEPEKVVISDPFMGTGTSILEAAKYKRVSPVGSDISEMAQLLYKDNQVFFADAPEHLREWGMSLDLIQDRNAPLYRRARTVFEKWEAEEDFSKPPEIAAKDEGDFVLRLILYLLLRSKRRYAADFMRQQQGGRTEELLWEAFKKEKEVLKRQMKFLTEQCARKLLSNGDSDDVSFQMFKGVFATSCIIDCGRIGNVSQRKIQDLPENFCDVVVSDPPYGFNTVEQFQGLAELYSTMLERMILALKKESGGQIVIAVPDWSHTGRQLPLFALKGLITQQMLVTAQRYSKEIFATTHIAHPSDLFRPPYYWESEHALRRAILHFRIRPKKITMSQSELELRPGTQADETFANNLLRRTMSRYVEETWPDEAAQKDYYEINPYKQSNTRIIQMNGKDIGRLSVTDKKDCLFVDELHILPEYQRLGIGEQIIKQVFREAEQKDLPVRLTVLAVNPAQRLYERMGFKVTEKRDHRLHMEYRRPSQTGLAQNK
jgi:ribosomal protein S18 acetylase RimI-like enzyme